MSYLKTAAAFAFTILLALVGIFSARAKQAQAERNQAKQRADIHQTTLEAHEKTDAALAELAKTQRDF